MFHYTTIHNFYFASFVAVQLPRLCYTTSFTISFVFWDR